MRDERHPEADTFKFRCDCGRKLRARLEMVGKVSVCPACGKKLTVPSPTITSNQSLLSQAVPKIYQAESVPFAAEDKPARKAQRSQVPKMVFLLAVGLIVVGGITLAVILLFAAREKTVEQIFEESKESVVVITTNSGVGSGFVVQENGFIATNFHVISRAGEGEIKVHIVSSEDGVTHTTTYEQVSVACENPDKDIAILHVKNLHLECLHLANRELTTGEKVVAIGNPAAGGKILDNTVSEGIISNTGRNISGVNYIQTTAPVNPGNSGGPLLNMKGEVIGMITLKPSVSEGIAFAIPASDIAKMLNETNGSSEKDPHARIMTVVELMENSEATSKIIVDLYAQEWHSAIYSDRDRDFNTALKKAVQFMEKPRERLRLARTEIEEMVADLKTHPDDLDKCYDCILKAYAAFCELADLAEEPEGSFTSFSQKKEDLHSAFKQAISQARVLVK
jgi:S1-C subfamily serine protease